MLFDPGTRLSGGGRHPVRRRRPRGSLFVRFNRYVIRSDDPAVCWEWQGGRFRSGYGALCDEPPSRRMLGAHRVSYQLHRGPIPRGLAVLHRCDVRCCVSPWHLFLGTPADNHRDMLDKQRQARGETHGRAKLTWHQVELMRAIRAAGASVREITAQFGVSRSLVSLVLGGKIWVTT